MWEKVKSFFSKVGLFFVFLVAFIIAVIFRKKTDDSEIEDQKDTVDKQNKTVDDQQEEVKDKTSSLKQTIKKAKDKSDEIKSDKKDRDKKASKFFPDL